MSFGPIFVSVIVIFNTMIPLSLYISLEIVKVFQMFLMQTDLDLYDPTSGIPMEFRTTTINEELGQVKYVLSDKTGTLTNNSMRFRKMSVLGLELVHDPKSQGHVTLQDEHRLSSAHARTYQLTLYTQTYPDSAFAKAINNFLLSIALCHTVIPETKANGDIDYQATSPDEAALVIAAKDLGYVLIDRQGQYITIKRHATDSTMCLSEEVYQILDILEFSSERKRMSVIVKTPERQLCMFCKSADSTIVPLLRLSKLVHDQARDVAKRAEIRKSIEAEDWLRRSFDVLSQRLSISRSSLEIERLSMSSTGRPSFGAKRSGSYIPLEERAGGGSVLLKGRLSTARASTSQARSLSRASEEDSPHFSIVPSDDVILANC